MTVVQTVSLVEIDCFFIGNVVFVGYFFEGFTAESDHHVEEKIISNEDECYENDRCEYFILFEKVFNDFSSPIIEGENLYKSVHTRVEVDPKIFNFF